MASKENKINDLDLWNLAIRDVKPIKKNISKSVKKEKPLQIPKKQKVVNTVTPKVGAVLKISEVRDISLKQAKKMDQGKLEVERTLDLHGMSITIAHKAFERCVEDCYANNLRNLLVITGKGLKSPNKEGKIKSQFLDWANSHRLRGMILRISPATQKHGGSGAYYVLLRRQR